MCIVLESKWRKRPGYCAFYVYFVYFVMCVVIFQIVCFLVCVSGGLEKICCKYDHVLRFCMKRLLVWLMCLFVKYLGDLYSGVMWMFQCV